MVHSVQWVMLRTQYEFHASEYLYRRNDTYQVALAVDRAAISSLSRITYQKGRTASSRLVIFLA